MSEFGYSYPEMLARKGIHDIYIKKFNNARRGRGFHNCAGFVKYLLGLSDKDGFVKPNDSTDKGLIRYLEQTHVMPVSGFNEGEWMQNSLSNNAVGFLQNKNNHWQYLHFIVPSPDPDQPFNVFERSDFEAEEPSISDIRNLIRDDAYKGDTSLVFFKLK